MAMHVEMRVRAVVVGLVLSHNLAFRRRTRPIINEKVGRSGVSLNCHFFYLDVLPPLTKSPRGTK